MTEVQLNEGENLIEIVVTDAVGLTSIEALTVVRMSGLPPPPENLGVSDLRPDLSIGAPALDSGDPTNLASVAGFLFSGPNPTVGVQPGVMDPARLAVIRGRIFDSSGEPLPEVSVSVLGKPEFGATLTRQNGTYDLAVNGGGRIVLDFVKDGFLPSQRVVLTDWQDFELVRDVVLVPLDPNMTVVDFSEPVQVAQGSRREDEDGARQATLLFFGGNQAEMVMPSGMVWMLMVDRFRAVRRSRSASGTPIAPSG